MSRIRELDFVKGCSILAVLAIHITAPFIHEAPFFAINGLSRFCVPVFFLISGLILFYRYGGENPFPLQDFYRKRLVYIMVPYFLWSLLYLIYSQWTDPQTVPDSLSGLFTALLIGKAYYHLYFLFVMVQFYLLFPFLRWFFRKWGGWVILVVAFWCTLGTQALTWEETKGLFSVQPEEEILRRTVLPWLFYFCAGGWLGLRFHHAFSRLRRLPLIALHTVSSAAGVLLVYQMAYLNHGGFYTPTTMVYALSILVLGIQLAQRFHFTWIEAVGKRSLGLYLIHPLVLHLSSSFSERWIPGGSWLQFFFVFAVVVSVSIGITKILERIPYGYLLKGR
ncbi:acyltransferase [Marinithermofilum abyssi]|uniref:Acyltransferase n=1 Tax=Marinithermofilum abyssi TaxID=1571185 RepID=A0A8J2VCU3_9BACL|nr:acyltransferase [Marinithermofilum abyssi]GGE16035.1 acyltransferase [Marinithermofilum abyssi]